LDARASKQRLTVCGDLSGGLSVMWDRIQVLGLALCGMVPVSHLITCDATARQWVVLLLVRTWACRVPLVMETLLGA
jgi:steroid 5-alpha reductase family enzyme